MIVGEDQLGEFRLPVQVKSDFVVHGASPGRVRGAHPPASVAGQRELRRRTIVAVDSLTINLATYQVKVAGEPLDLTYLEYALLAFLVTHPGRAYSRDALLRRVWGFDYYGGSRTVDVHVRRVRAKLGPDLAQSIWRPCAAWAISGAPVGSAGAANRDLSQPWRLHRLAAERRRRSGAVV